MTSARLAASVIDTLVRSGVREAVLCPGSRNAPLAYALHRADELGRLRLHVRIDERSAGFLALGLAVMSRRPVPVVTTSGTAAANLHPAVLEASHQGVPLIAVTADRPPSLVGTGANQTTDQARLFGSACRWYAGLDAADPDEAPAVTARALGWATGALSHDPGPVQLNVALREPLVAPSPDVDTDPATLPEPRWDGAGDGPAPSPRTLVVAGGAVTPWTPWVIDAAQRNGWPVVAEHSAGLGRTALAHGPLLLDAASLPAPDHVVVVGNPTLHRSVQRLLSRSDVTVVAGTPRWPDAARVARRVVTPGWLRATAGSVERDEGFGAAWTQAASRASSVVDEALGAVLDGPAVARAVVAALPSGAVLQAGSSNPVRDLDLAADPRDDVRVLANRGLAGIDGTLAAACGAALAGSGPTYALVGDLTFRHDVNGLLVGPHEPRPDLTVVVVNDGGGGIFATLEQGAADAPRGFERLFGTPVPGALAGLCAGVGVTHRRCEDAAALAAAVRERPRGVTVVEVSIDRDGRRDRDESLRAAVRAAVDATD